MADPQDLASLAFVTSLLDAGGVALTSAQTTALPSLITSASYEVARYCRRWFVVSVYDEVKTPYAGLPDRGQPDWIDLTYMPVIPNTVTRVASGRCEALNVTNSDTVTNQRAYLELVTSGDPDITLTPTGVKLTRVASGVTTTNTLLFATYVTVQALATAINAVGNGWVATLPDAALGLWASADLYTNPGPQASIGTDTGTGFDLFVNDLARFAVDYSVGHVRLPTGGYGGRYGRGGSWVGPFGAPEDETMYGGAGFRSPVRVTYSAGFTTIPLPLQQATAEMVKASLFRLRSDDSLKSETAKDYTYIMRDLIPSLSAYALRVLNSYKVA